MGAQSGTQSLKAPVTMSLGLCFLVASLLKVVSCEEKILKLPSFDLLSVTSLIKVQVAVDANISEASLKLEAPDSALSLISSDVWPTAYGPVLVLGRSPARSGQTQFPSNSGRRLSRCPRRSSPLEHLPVPQSMLMLLVALYSQTAKVRSQLPTGLDQTAPSQYLLEPTAK